MTDFGVVTQKRVTHVGVTRSWVTARQNGNTAWLGTPGFFSDPLGVSIASEAAAGWLGSGIRHSGGLI
jgi:hypothetical protein